MLFERARMDKFQLPGVQALPGEALFGALAVDLVAQQRVADVRHVDADLVGAARFEAASAGGSSRCSGR